MGRFFISRECEQNLESNHGWTPLFEAVFKGHSEIAKFLIDSGGNAGITSKSDKTNTPLYYASHEGHLRLAKLLFNHGSDPDDEGHKEWLHVTAAASDGSKKI
jgi:ankyrin repeat protein